MIVTITQMGLLTRRGLGRHQAQSLLCCAFHKGWQLGVWSFEPLCDRTAGGGGAGGHLEKRWGGSCPLSLTSFVHRLLG